MFAAEHARPVPARKLEVIVNRHIIRLIASVVVALSAGVAWADSFTLLPAGSPSLGATPATTSDILYDTPGPLLRSVGIPFAALGLGPLDVVDAISDGLDPVNVPGHTHYFSVTPGSAGAPGSGVAAEVAGDTPPGVSPGHASDIFLAGGGIPVGTNILAPAGLGWTLGTTTGDEANVGLVNPIDNVNSYDLATIPPPTPLAPIYFSLAAGSPSLGVFSPADIFVSTGAGAFAVFIPSGALVIPPIADIDALALLVIPGGGYAIEYSLTTGTAGLIGTSGAAILGGSSPIFGPFVLHTPASIGLLVTDDLDALDVAVPEPATVGLLAIGTMLLIAYRQKCR
jgi:hypothetical protein